MLAALGPHLASSQMPASSSSDTGMGANELAVRASVNSRALPSAPN